ncbi:MAG: homoserine dehydrogenase [Clostridiales bacterium]|nr:homoserine dehydrogenase [Clostridiales bacterium]
MVNIAVMGYGTVGSGVVEVMNTNHDKIASSAAQQIKVKYILDVRDFSASPYKELFIKDFEIIENDPDIKIVVETIGGTGIAQEFTRRCLLAGKSVVTSNKELVANHGHELITLAKERNLNYLFEASVGGGIPILRPISQCLAANEINEIYGILNGTTNYILTRMIKNGVSMEEALAEAKYKGYAEKDPKDDIEGYDTCRKICILSDLSFRRHIYPSQVPTKGISQVEARDVSLLAASGDRIKLVARAVRTGESSVAVYVEPHVVLKDNLLANVEDVFNCIMVRGNAIGDTMFYGKGAGKLPTASAVVADVIDASKHINARKYVDWSAGGPDAVTDSALLENRMYIRAAISPERVRELFGCIKVIDVNDTQTAFMTEEVLDLYELREKIGDTRVFALYRVLD